MAYRGMADPAQFTQAVRASSVQWYTVDATYKGQPVAGATGLLPTGGTITDTTKPGVRRTLNLELPGTVSLYELLKPTGTLLTATCNVRMTDRSVVQVPMGVFDIDDGSVSEGGPGTVKITAPDKWQRIVRAKFVVPQASNAGAPIVQQIADLIRGALGSAEPVTIRATSQELMPTMTWASDRAQAIIDLATSIGAWVYFDRQGIATIADIPQVGYTADWTIDAGPAGVAVSIDRRISRTSTFNVVAVASSAAAADRTFEPVFVWDSDPSSPTYAGPDPKNHPELAGPFGIATYVHETSTIYNTAQAAATAYAILSTTVGLASGVTVTAAPNPALDAFDALDVVTPGSTHAIITGTTGGAGLGSGGFGTVPFGGGTPGVPRIGWDTSGQVVERHVADTVTHQLDVTQPQHIDGRSTRTDSYA